MTKRRDPGEFYRWLGLHGLTEDRLAELAKIARDTHMAFKLARYGRRINPAAPVTPDWKNVAMRAVECDAPPAEYVASHWSQSRDPYVNFMGSRAGKDTYPEKQVQKESLVKQRVKLQSERLLRWRKEDTRGLREMLTDPRGQFEPAFIYCIARWEKLDDLVAENYNEAARTFTDPTTLKVFAGAFPEAFGRV